MRATDLGKRIDRRDVGRVLRGLAVVILVVVGLCQVASAKETLSWRKLYTEKGITVWAGERASSDLPVLRGVGEIPVNLYHLLAIVEDVKRHPEWVYRVVRSEIIDRPDPFHIMAYLRFDFPWPTSDRDGLVKIEVVRQWKPHHQVWIKFRRTVDRRRPPYPDVVRVPWSRGFTRLRWLGSRRTEVIYQIDTDPGGLLPKWLVRWISKDLPVRVLLGLRRQIRKTLGQYEGFINSWDPRRRWQPDSPASFQLPGVPAAKLARKPAPPSLSLEGGPR